MTQGHLVGVTVNGRHMDLEYSDWYRRTTWPCGRVDEAAGCGTFTAPCDCPPGTIHAFPEVPYNGPC